MALGIGILMRAEIEEDLHELLHKEINQSAKVIYPHQIEALPRKIIDLLEKNLKIN